METLLDELAFPPLDRFIRITVRVLMALLLSGIIGWERERTGKAAGLRTHLLVGLGSALFVLLPLQAGMPLADVSRVIQGVATGIGFLGAGAILKLSEERQIKGLTTAAGIWLTAAVGVAAGAGWYWPALLAVLLGWVVLRLLGRLERWLGLDSDQ